MIHSDIKPFTGEVFTDINNYLDTQFFYEQDRLLHQWLIQTYRNIINAPLARCGDFNYIKELNFLFEILLPKIAQIEHNAKRVTS